MLRILVVFVILVSYVIAYSNVNRYRNRIQGFILKPTLLIQTSQSFANDEKKSAFLSECSSTVAKVLGKPEQYVMISYKISDGMMYGGSEEPSAFLHLASIGKIGPEYNPVFSEAICKTMTKHLGIPSNRVYIQFYDSSAANFGFDGKTFG